MEQVLLELMAQERRAGSSEKFVISHLALFIILDHHRIIDTELCYFKIIWTKIL
jgi:hypothetical protein